MKGHEVEATDTILTITVLEKIKNSPRRENRLGVSVLLNMLLSRIYNAVSADAVSSTS